VRRVLVTRPEPGAARTARRLEELGFTPVVLPLFETRSLFVDRGAIPEGCGAVAVTSANAILHAPTELIANLASTRCFAVGGGTAAAARAAGFLAVVEGPGDAEGLARTIIAEAATDTTVLYLCGHVRRPDFERLLASAGIAVRAVETYTTARTDDAANTAEALREPIDAVLLHSVTAAQAFAEMTKRAHFAEIFGNAEILCLSARIAAALDDKGLGKIRVAREPTEAALLSLLGQSG
jgi:uroporphyrinogen-III synthase